jgi:ethanolamine-phosphate cytidylyltransferase
MSITSYTVRYPTITRRPALLHNDNIVSYIGDDPCIVDGKDVYEAAQKAGKYLTIPRTEGVLKSTGGIQIILIIIYITHVGISTTDIVGRMLLMTRAHHSALQVSSDVKIAH